MQWDSYPPVEHAGTTYGLKSSSFAPFADLPALCHDTFELALGCPSGVRENLTTRGWTVLDPRGPTRDPWTYQDYIARSKAEFSVAKQAYVMTQSGWFSERSAGYLASGRPVVVQETGFSRWLAPTAGVLAFSSPDEAVSQLEALNRSYLRHCREARDVAGDYFGSTHILADLLEAAVN
jgi:hypothetical protein